MKEIPTTYKMSTSQLVIEDETGSNTSSRRHSHDGIRSFTICHGNYGNSPHRSPSFFLGERNVSPYFNLDSTSTLNMDTLINNNKPAETENVLKIPNFVGKNRIDTPESRSCKSRSSPVRPRRFSQDSDQILGLVYKSLSQTSLDANIQMRSSADNIRTNSCADTVALRSAHSTETNPGFESTLDDIIESPFRNTRTAQEITRKWREMTKAQSRTTKTTTTTAALKDAFGPRLSSEDLQLPPYSTDQDNIGLIGDPISNSGGKKPNIKDKVPSGEDFTGDGGISPRWNQYVCSNREGLDPESLMFRDGRRKIDLVLAFEEEDLGVMTEHEAKMRDQRRTFLANLIKEGLELELEDKRLSFDEKTWFLKVHVPWKTETRYAEVMNMKLPTKRFITISVKAWDDEKTAVKDKKFLSKWRSLYKTIFEYDHTLIEEEPSFYGATAGKDREEQFIVKDRATTFTSAQRSLIAMQILLRVKYDDTEKVGIRRLLNDGTYLACFPLHEGRYECNQSDGTILDRRLLYLEWARPSKFYKKQPICLVRKYFGDQIGLYFAWLGFYTKMLYAPAIVGTLCFLYGLASMDSLDNVPSREICDTNGPGNITLCPLCDKACRYQKLSNSCLFSRITYLFDNPATVFFAIFMSFWARTFLELWKRKQNTLVWEWDLHDVEQDEEPRPEFETSVKTFRINPVTKEKEPYMPAWSRALRFIATGSAVLFMIVVVLGAVLGTIIYRISLVSVIYTGGGEFIQTHAKLFTTMTAALINLTIIMILTRLYHKLAISLTNLENPRTQTEYEESYTFKIFLFEFMNFYSSLIYIAFFKGRFYDYPGDGIARKSEFFRLKGDVCDPAGCLSELCIQLAIIMIGKQVFNNFLEILYPKMWNWWRQRSHRANTKDLSRDHMSWEQDYHLQDPGRLALFDEYLEMILQYGFVTLFVAAFPLAPLFALLNNIAEIRLDAYKMVTQARRPLAERVEDIGAWERILSGITYVAVISNAFVIAYTSDFIPRMVYKFVYSESHTLVGYIDHSLSVFNTSDYQAGWGSDDNDPDPPTCQYRGYRNGPEHPDDAYGLSPHYWHVFAARLSFVVIFEHVVYLSIWVMRFVIPTTPSEVKTQIQREKLLAKEAKYEHGLKKNQDMEYEELISALRENNVSRAGQSQPGIRRSSWARRLSRVSDGLDAHVEVSSRPRKSMGSTVWEVT